MCVQVVAWLGQQTELNATVQGHVLDVMHTDCLLGASSPLALEPAYSKRLQKLLLDAAEQGKLELSVSFSVSVHSTCMGICECGVRGHWLHVCCIIGMHAAVSQEALVSSYCATLQHPEQGGQQWQLKTLVYAAASMGDEAVVAAIFEKWVAGLRGSCSTGVPCRFEKCAVICTQKPRDSRQPADGGQRILFLVLKHTQLSTPMTLVMPPLCIMT